MADTAGQRLPGPCGHPYQWLFHPQGACRGGSALTCFVALNACGSCDPCHINMASPVPRQALELLMTKDKRLQELEVQVSELQVSWLGW